jgi:hypothetical protein
MILQKGVYYIGDLCYVMDQEWEEVCDLIRGDQYPNEGQFRLSDGRQFAIFNTAYGDGEYYDMQGRSYSVDSGTLGCIKVDNLTEDVDENLGNVVEMPHDFYCYSDGKTIYFGHVAIETE